MEEKKAEREEQRRRDAAMAAQMIKDSNLAVVLDARQQEVTSPPRDSFNHSPTPRIMHSRR